jgi:hypothetical protein
LLTSQPEICSTNQLIIFHTLTHLKTGYHFKQQIDSLPPTLFHSHKWISFNQQVNLIEEDNYIEVVKDNQKREGKGKHNQKREEGEA